MAAEARYDPTEEESLTMFMRLGCPDLSINAYHDLDPDTVVFHQGNEIITAGDVRQIQSFLRRAGVTVGKGRLQELMEQMPVIGNG